jgi:hypothetical protein
MNSPASGNPLRVDPRGLVVVLGLLLLVAIPGSVPAKSPETGPEAIVPEKELIVRRIAQNRVSMMGYQWKARLEVRRGKKVVLTRVEEMWFNDDGFWERELLVETPEKREKKKKKKKDEKGDTVEEVIRLVRTYLLPSALGLDETLRKAVVTPGMGPDEGLTRVQVDDYNQVGDVIVYWLDNTNQRVKKVEVESRLKKNRVLVTADFQLLEGGPNIAARTLVKVPKKNLEILQENFDFVRREDGS